MLVYDGLNQIVSLFYNKPITILNAAQLVTSHEEITEGINSTSTQKGQQAST